MQADAIHQYGRASVSVLDGRSGRPGDAGPGALAVDAGPGLNRGGADVRCEQDDADHLMDRHGYASAVSLRCGRALRYHHRESRAGSDGHLRPDAARETEREAVRRRERCRGAAWLCSGDG